MEKVAICWNRDTGTINSEKWPPGVRESCLISCIRLKVKEYFESQLMTVLEEGSWVGQQSSSISKIGKFR